MCKNTIQLNRIIQFLAACASSPAQMGALSTFAPPMKGLVTNNALLIRFRRSFHIILKKLNMDGLPDHTYNGWSNLSRRLPFMLLQYDGDRPDLRRCDAFYTKLRDEDVFDVRVGDFVKKSLKSHKVIERKCDFKTVLLCVNWKMQR